MGMRVYAVCEILGQAKEVQMAMLEGSVGIDAATDFYEWEQAADLPPPEEVLQKGFTPTNSRLDIAVAVLTSTTQFVITTQDRQEAERWAILLWQLIYSFIQANMGDMTLAPAQALGSKNLSRSAGGAIEAAAGPALLWYANSKILHLLNA
jgi:hypothetical protein